MTVKREQQEEKDIGEQQGNIKTVRTWKDRRISMKKSAYITGIIFFIGNN